MIGVAVTFRGNQAKVTRYEPLASGMCDTLIDIDGDAVWVSSHELKRVDGTPIPSRRDVIRQAEREALESLHAIREQHVRDFNIPWPGAEHGKAIVGQAINEAIRELEAKTSSGADVPCRSTVAQGKGEGSATVLPSPKPTDATELDAAVLRELAHRTATGLPTLALNLNRDPVDVLDSLERLMRVGRVTSRKRSNGRVVYRSDR